ncbi:MAG: Fe-S cluster domain-containing protein [Verrucomicrobia bacterium]|nr:Fe-S cluster domain-containing protein [Prolixibacteraceae bacterium]
MSTIILYTVLILSIIGILSAIILYFVAQKFKVFEDPRIDEIEATLPGANCGGCGYAGCRAFADACVSKGELSILFCPVGGNDTMGSVADILGIVAVKKDPRVAVLRCNGSCEFRPKTNVFDGAVSCAIASSLYSGDTGCQYGCLGCGDCVVACDFDAIHMNPVTGLPEVVDDKCVACGACVKACPKTLIELRKKAPKDRKIYVACRNEDKGGIARKSCSVACIGCSKCEKECKYDAIIIANNLAFIDSDKCKLCRKCVSVCPTNSIIELNFPPRKVAVEEPAVAVAEKVKEVIVKNPLESGTSEI